jgi:hypothetical protein
VCVFKDVRLQSSVSTESKAPGLGSALMLSLDASRVYVSNIKVDSRPIVESGTNDLRKAYNTFPPSIPTF